MENTSGLRPLGRAVLVEYHTPERKESLIHIPDSVVDRVNAVEQRAVVIAVGPACWPDEPPRAKPGDVVLISKMAGYQCRGKDGKPYRLVNDRDLFCGITDPEVMYG
jgi:co-chaperonin GroES (HSP10)